MKHRLHYLLFALIIGALVLAGCQQPGQSIPSDPVEAVKQIADKQNEVKSQHLDVTLDFTLNMDGLPADDPTAVLLQNFEASLTLNGDVDSATQNFKFNGAADLGPLNAFLGQGGDKVEFDLVKVGDTLYSRLAGQDWSESPVDMSGSGNGGADAALDPERITQLLKKVARAERLGDESIDGVDTYHFKVNLDPVELVSEIASIAAETGSEVDTSQLDEANALLKDAVIEVEIWAGKADLLVRQEKIHFNLNLTEIPDSPGVSALIDLALTVKTSKLNESVNIAAPQ
jgi:hypothetical protein